MASKSPGKLLILHSHQRRGDAEKAAAHLKDVLSLEVACSTEASSLICQLAPGTVLIVATHTLPNELGKSIEPLILLTPQSLIDAGLDEKTARVIELDSADQGLGQVLDFPPSPSRGPRLAFPIALRALASLGGKGMEFLQHWVKSALPTSPAEARAPGAEHNIGTVELGHKLSTNDYKEWVYDQIAGRIYKKFGFFFSLIGVGGMLALGAIAWSVIDSNITTRVTGQKSDITSEITRNMQSLVTERVATTLLKLSDVEKKVSNRTQEAIDGELKSEGVKKQAQSLVQAIVKAELNPAKIKALVEQEITNEETRKKLVDAAAEKLRTERGIQEVILTQVRPEVIGPNQAANPTQRAGALQMLVLLEDKNRLRKTIRDILLTENNVDSEVFEIALSKYVPENVTSDRKVFLHVIRKFADRRDLSDKLLRRLVSFVAAFPDDHAVQVTEVVKQTTTGSRFLIRALAAMKGDGVVTALADLAADKNDEAYKLGWIGLSLLGERDIDLETRIETLKRLWPLSNTDVLSPQTDLSRLNYAATTAPAPRELTNLIRLLESSGSIHRRVAGFLLHSVRRKQRLLREDVAKIRERLESIRSQGEINEADYKLIELVLRGGAEIGREVALALSASHLTTGDPHLVLEQLRASGALKPFAYEFLRPHLGRLSEGLSAFDAERLRDRIDFVHRRRHISDSGYRRLLAAIQGDSRDTSRVIRALRDLYLRDEIESLIVVSELSDALGANRVAKARHLLKRFKDRMSTDAYRQLSQRLNSATVGSAASDLSVLKPLVIRLAERIIRLEERLAAQPESATPIVDARLKNAVLASLVPPATNVDDWSKALARLGQIESNSTIERRAPLLTVFSQRARASLAKNEPHDAYNRLAATLLSHSDWQTHSTAIALLVHAISACPEQAIDSHVSSILAADDHTAVQPLAAVLRRRTDEERHDEFAEFVRKFNLKEGTSKQKKMFIEALERTMRPDSLSRNSSAPRLVLLRGAVAALEAAGTPKEKRDALDFIHVIFDAYLGDMKRERSAPEPGAKITPARLSPSAAFKGEQAKQTTMALERSGIARPLKNLTVDKTVSGQATALLNRLGKRVSWVQTVPQLRDFGPGQHTLGGNTTPTSSEVWYKLPAAETNEYWVRVAKGSAEVAIVDGDMTQVIREPIVEEHRPIEVREKKAGFLRIRPRGQEQTRLNLEVRPRPAELRTSGDPKSAPQIEFGQKYRGTIMDRRRGRGFVRFYAKKGDRFLVRTDRLTSDTVTTLKLLNVETGSEKTLARNDTQIVRKGVMLDWISGKAQSVALEIGSGGGRFDLSVDQLENRDVGASYVAAADQQAARMPADQKIISITFEDDRTSGWLAFQLEKNAVYRLSSDAYITIKHGDKEVVRFAPRQTFGASHVDRPHYLIAGASDAYDFMVDHRGRLDEAQIRVEAIDPTKSPEYISAFPIGTEASSATALTIPPKSGDGWLVGTNGTPSFVPLELQQGKSYRLAVVSVAGTPIARARLIAPGNPIDADDAIKLSRSPHDITAEKTGKFLLVIEPGEGSALPAYVQIQASERDDLPFSR